MDYEISVVVPAYNEVFNLQGAVENINNALNEFDLKGEIIIVNDGSTDDTTGVITALSEKYSHLRSIHHSTNLGYGYSLWEGMRSASGEIVVSVPGDGENDCQEILRYYELMQHVDMVVPFVYNVENRVWYRRWVSRFYKLVVNTSFFILLNYMNGTVMYRRCILDDIELKSKGFFVQTELLINLIKRGYLYAEVPYAIKERAMGQSSAISLKSFAIVVYSYFLSVFSVIVQKKRPLSPQSVSFRRRQY